MSPHAARPLAMAALGASAAFVGFSLGGMVLVHLGDILSELAGWDPQSDIEPGWRLYVSVLWRFSGVLIVTCLAGAWLRSRGRAVTWKEALFVFNPITVTVGYAAFLYVGQRAVQSDFWSASAERITLSLGWLVFAYCLAWVGPRAGTSG